MPLHSLSAQTFFVYAPGLDGVPNPCYTFTMELIENIPTSLSVVHASGERRRLLVEDAGAKTFLSDLLRTMKAVS